MAVCTGIVNSEIRPEIHPEKYTFPMLYISASISDAVSPCDEMKMKGREEKKVMNHKICSNFRTNFQANLYLSQSKKELFTKLPGTGTI